MKYKQFAIFLFFSVALVFTIAPLVAESASLISDLTVLTEQDHLEFSKYIVGYDRHAVEFDSNHKPAQADKVSWICMKKQHVFVGYDRKESVFFHLSSCATGRNTGQKLKVGDMRTPEGNFVIQQIQDASWWPPYEDKETGEKTGYGPYFIRIDAGIWKGIGIHGTDDAHLNEIGTNASHGCIRLENDDLGKIVELAEIGQQVIILPQ